MSDFYNEFWWEIWIQFMVSFKWDWRGIFFRMKIGEKFNLFKNKIILCWFRYLIISYFLITLIFQGELIILSQNFLFFYFANFTQFSIVFPYCTPIALIFPNFSEISLTFPHVLFIYGIFPKFFRFFTENHLDFFPKIT